MFKIKCNSASRKVKWLKFLVYVKYPLSIALSSFYILMNLVALNYLYAYIYAVVLIISAVTLSEIRAMRYSGYQIFYIDSILSGIMLTINPLGAKANLLSLFHIILPAVAVLALYLFLNFYYIKNRKCLFTSETVKYCPKCRKEISSDFCPDCGSGIKEFIFPDNSGLSPFSLFCILILSFSIISVHILTMAL